MTNRVSLRGLRVPYVCPLPDEPGDWPRAWRGGSGIVRFGWHRGEPLRVLTGFLRLPDGRNLVLFELWFDHRWTR